MIGGLVAMTLDKSILGQLGTGRRSVVVTGTNGKSTTTRMTAAALRTLGPVASNTEGSNMDAGLIAALAADRDAQYAALEVDEMHVPHVADAISPSVIVLLNLSRDQLDRVGEINHIERTLRAGLARHPDATIVANCDDVLMTSAAYDCPNVVWVAAGGGWAGDSVSCPRSGEVIASLAAEGGLQSARWAGPDTANRPVELELGYAADDVGYLVDLGLPVPSSSMFDRDPHLKREAVFAGPSLRPASTLVQRDGPTAYRCGDAGGRQELTRSLPSYRSVLTEFADPAQLPELAAVRDRLRGWRFYDGFRADAAAPADVVVPAVAASAAMSVRRSSRCWPSARCTATR